MVSPPARMAATPVGARVMNCASQPTSERCGGRLSYHYQHVPLGRNWNLCWQQVHTQVAVRDSVGLSGYSACSISVQVVEGFG